MACIYSKIAYVCNIAESIISILISWQLQITVNQRLIIWQGTCWKWWQ